MEKELRKFLQDKFGIGRNEMKRLSRERDKSALFNYLEKKNREYENNVNPAWTLISQTFTQGPSHRG